MSEQQTDEARLVFSCPECGTSLTVAPQERIRLGRFGHRGWNWGATVTCPSCGHRLGVGWGGRSSALVRLRYGLRFWARATPDHRIVIR
jgi:predicted RNA-binding Zn-ribbon protein involved in translation (DUF1610 family)